MHRSNEFALVRQSERNVVHAQPRQSEEHRGEEEQASTKVTEALKRVSSSSLVLLPAFFFPLSRSRSRSLAFPRREKLPVEKRSRIAPSRKVSVERERWDGVEDREGKMIKTDRFPARRRRNDKFPTVLDGTEARGRQGWCKKEIWLSSLWFSWPQRGRHEVDTGDVASRVREMKLCCWVKGLPEKRWQKEETKGDRVWAAISPSNGARSKTKEWSVELKHNKATVREDRRKRGGRRWRRNKEPREQWRAGHRTVPCCCCCFSFFSSFFLPSSLYFSALFLFSQRQRLVVVSEYSKERDSLWKIKSH